MSERTAKTTQDVVIERDLDAPPELVWQLWTTPTHFAAWYGPTGASIPVAEMDVRPGGSRRIGMTMATPNGEMTMWFVGEYLVVDEPRRLVYTEAVADETGRVLAPAEMGLPDDQPTLTEVTVELEPIGNRTHMTLTHAGVPAGSPGEMGWQMALDKLEARVASVA